MRYKTTFIENGEERKEADYGAVTFQRGGPGRDPSVSPYGPVPKEWEEGNRPGDEKAKGQEKKGGEGKTRRKSTK